MYLITDTNYYLHNLEGKTRSRRKDVICPVLVMLGMGAPVVVSGQHDRIIWWSASSATDRYHIIMYHSHSHTTIKHDITNCSAVCSHHENYQSS